MYRRTIDVDGDPGVVEVEPGGPDHLLLRAHLPHWEGLIHLVARVRRIFGLDADPGPASATLASDPIVGRLVRTRPGSRIAGTWDPFEIGVRAIIGQQVSVAGADTITARLVERHGVPVAGLALSGCRPSSRAPSCSPTPSSTASGSRRPAPPPSARSARRSYDDKLPLDRSVPLSELVEAVGAIDGLGPWTAQYLAVRLGEPDAFPAGDLGLRRAVGRITGRATAIRGPRGARGALAPVARPRGHAPVDGIVTRAVRWNRRTDVR